MKIIKIICVVVILLHVDVAYSQNLFFDRDGLVKRQKNRSLVSESDMKRLMNNADKILALDIKTVVDKKKLPASGNKHDYYSLATYWWHNPKTKSGLPYIRRDGKPNPKRLEITDHENLKILCENVKILSLAYFFTNENKYLNKIEEYLVKWFIDDRTKMNPHLKYAQAIPGVSDGSVVGTIDTRVLPEMLNALSATQVQNSLNKEVLLGLNDWISSYSLWLRDSDFVKKNLNKINNNVGTAYYMQLISYSQFVNGQNNQIDGNVKKQLYSLLDVQFTKKGIQKFEGNREDSSVYTLSNLIYWYNISDMLSENNIDLWNYTGENGKNLREAYDFWYKNINNKAKLDNRALSLISLSDKVYNTGKSKSNIGSNNFITNLTSPLF